MSARIIIRTQAEFDALPENLDQYTTIEIRSDAAAIIQVREAWGHSHVEAWESSHVEAMGSSHVVARESSHVVAGESSHVEAMGSSRVVAGGSSHVEAWGSSHVEAMGSSHVVARGHSHVEAWDSSHVVAWGQSHVEAWGQSHVVARDSSQVEAWGQSHVVARDSSQVEAWGHSHVEAWESSHVEAMGGSHVVAWDSSHVVAWGQSHVEAWGQSHVVAWGSVSVHLCSDCATVVLFWIAVCLNLASGKVIRKSSRATVIEAAEIKADADWLDMNGVEPKDGSVTLYKRVSKDFLTRENTDEETRWTPGTVVTHLNWIPTTAECGQGKFHGCPASYLADEFRNTSGDRYVAISVKTSDLHAWRGFPEYPHKIAFREGTVLYECDRYGKQITTEITA